MAHTALNTIPFSGGAGVDVVTTYSTLTNIVGDTAGYLVQDGSGRMYSAFGTSTARLLRSGSGSFTNDQYAQCVLTDIVTGFGSDWVYLVLQSSADTGANADYYAARVSNGTTKTTEIIRVNNGSITSLASHTTTAWVDGDLFLVELVGSVLKIYRNGGEVLSYDDSGGLLSGGRAGFGYLPTAGATYYIDDVELGNVTSTPVITAHPSSTAVTEPATANFTATATGSTSLQWQYSTDGGTTPLSVIDGTGGTTGTTSADYTTSATAVSSGNHRNGYVYRCGFTNGGGTTYTNWATLTVNASGGGFKPRMSLLGIG